MPPLDDPGVPPPKPLKDDSAAWREAMAWGIDVSLLEHNLTLTVEERLQQLDEMTRLYELLKPPDDATRPEDA